MSRGKIESFENFAVSLPLIGRNAQKNGNDVKKRKPRLLYQFRDLSEFGMFGGFEQLKQGRLDPTGLLQ